jgi:hypothetical protein
MLRAPRSSAVLVLATLAAAIALAASASTVSCVSYALPPLVDAGADAAPAAVTITTLAPPTTSAPGGKLSAAWAAWQVDDGAWQPLAPSDTGVYGLPSKGTRWAIALACDDTVAQSSTVAIYRRSASVTALEITLPDPCTLPPPPAFQLTGTLANVPTTTSWLEFGYPLESRGFVLPVNGTNAPYELVNVVNGTWDVAFGVRDTSTGPLTRVTILRARAVTRDDTLDLDLGSGATAAFTPGKRALLVHGVTADESLTPIVAYGTGGLAGLALGPQDVPPTPPDVAMTYSTVPSAAALAGDRYEVDVSAQVDKDIGTLREVSAAFHADMDVEVTLPDALPLPTATVAATQPYVRVATSFAPRAGSASYLVDVIASVTRRSQRRFVTSIEPGLLAPTETMPDLSSVTGFDPSWGLPSAHTTVTVTAIEPDAPFGDGTRHRQAAAQIIVTQ